MSKPQNQGAAELAAWLERMKWSIRKLAAHLDADDSSVRSWLNGTIPNLPRADDLQTICAIEHSAWLRPPLLELMPDEPKVICAGHTVRQLAGLAPCSRCHEPQAGFATINSRGDTHPFCYPCFVALVVNSAMPLPAEAREEARKARLKALERIGAWAVPSAAEEVGS